MYGLHKDFEDILETAALEFLENLDNYDEIVSVYHTDADGLGSGLLIKEMVKNLDKSYKGYSNTLEQSWDNYLKKLEKNMKKRSAIIFSDLAPPIDLLESFLEENPEIHVYILDHHLQRIKKDSQIHENIYNCNPTQFGLNGLKEIVGSTLNYMFAKAVDEKNEKMAWIATLAMAGDTLQHFGDYSSYNRKVAEEAIIQEKIEVKFGICAFGGQFERADQGLAHSILPYMPQIEGKKEKAAKILKDLNIPPKTKIADLDDAQQQLLAEKLRILNLLGEYLVIPKKKNILHFTFEHAQLLSIIGHDNPNEAFRLISAPHASRESKKKYLTYIENIINNLNTFMKMKKDKTEHALIVDLTNKLPPDQWSDTSTFATINKIYQTNKVLLLGGIKDGKLKFSVRCSQKFVDLHNGKGAKTIIHKLMDKVGGDGGGHALAGGFRIESDKKEEIIDKIDFIIETL